VHTRGEPLRPVARISTNRQRLILFGQARQPLAEVASDDVSAQALGDTTTVSRWHELEVELTGGDQDCSRPPMTCCAATACAGPEDRPSWNGPWAAS